MLSPLPQPSDLFVLSLPSVFHTIPETRLNDLRAAARLAHHKKGHIILTQGDVADWFYIVQSGWVKLYRETLNGNEVILDLVNTNGMFGETAYFLNQTYPFSAETLVDCAIWSIPQSCLIQAIQNTPAFAMALMTHMARAQTARDKDLEHHTTQNAAQRLGCFILRLCENDAAGSVILTLPLDKHIIAGYLGMKPETFSRTLAKLGTDVGLTIDGDQIHIPRLNDLVRYTCQSCSNVFPCES
jgi:CRP-like cAMP-binding protein